MMKVRELACMVVLICTKVVNAKAKVVLQEVTKYIYTMEGLFSYIDYSFAF